MSGTSPTGLNQAERNRLAAASCKRGRLHIRRQLERRKSSNHPIRRCRIRSPALCERHQDLPDKRVGRVSLPTKRQKRCIFYYAVEDPTLAVEGLSKAAKQHSRYAENAARSTPRGGSRLRGPHLWGPHPAQGYHTKAPNRNHDPAPNSHLWGPLAPIPTSQLP
jgi:hypothetical protein